LTGFVRTLPAVLIVAVYLGLETVAISRARHRMEPDYIYQRLVEARVAAERCGGIAPDQEAGFERVLERALARLQRERATAAPPVAGAAIEAEIADLTRSGELEAVAALESGCDSPEARQLLGRHRIYSRK